MNKLILLLMVSSCSFKGSFQGLYSYYDKTKKLNPDLINTTSSIGESCEPKYTSQIDIITGENLKKCFEPNSLVYIWKPNCSSKFCYSLNLIQELCDKNEIELFIVAEYYDSEKMNLVYKIDKNIFGIDVKFYRTNKTKKYLSRFFSDLGVSDTIHENFIYFENRNFKKSFNDIDSISTL